jgi:Zn-dependent protease with chaperone function
MGNVQHSPKRTLREISPRAWQHPADAAALAALEKVPGLPELTKKLIGATTEKSLYLLHMASAVRVTADQFPRVHSLYNTVCEMLDAPERPVLFVSQAPFLNAGAVGADHPFITLNSSAVDTFTDAELSNVLAHELGHCMSGHVLYKTLLQFLLRIPFGMIRIPGAGIALTAIIAALSEWDRKSELSADRAGVLGAQDPAAAQTTLMKLAGGADLAQMNVGAFLQQAHEYHDGSDLLESVHKLLNVLWRSHPFPVARISEIKTWIDGGAYQATLDGNYVKRGQDSDEDLGETFRQARDKYREELKDSQDPLATAADKVLGKIDELGDQLKGVFGSMFER